MPTSNQLSEGARIPIRRSTRALRIFGKAPQRRGVVYKLVIITPRKPNSARRKVAKVRLCHNGKRVFTQIPGIGHYLHEHSVVMVEGGGSKDLPGVNFSLMRGLEDFTSMESFDRRRKRSKYGLKKDAERERDL